MIKKLLASIAFAIFTVPALSAGQTYSMVVTFPVGNQADIAARTISANYEKITGNVLKVENVPGGDTMIGVRHFKNNQRDILLGSGASLIFNPVLVKDLFYNDQDFSNEMTIGTAASVWVASIDSGITSPQDLVAKMPEKVGGYVVSYNYNLKFLNQAKGTRGEIVHYKGSNQLLVDLANGSVKLGIMSVNNTLIGLAREGKVRIVATGYSEAITVGDQKIPSVEQSLGVKQYCGYQTVSLRPGIVGQERTQLIQDLWQAVQMSRPVLAKMNMLPDATRDTQQINSHIMGLRQLIRENQSQ